MSGALFLALIAGLTIGILIGRRSCTVKLRRAEDLKAMADDLAVSAVGVLGDPEKRSPVADVVNWVSSDSRRRMASIHGGYNTPWEVCLTEKTDTGRRSFTGKGPITSAARAAVEAMRKGER